MTIHHLSCGSMRPVGSLLINGEGGMFDKATVVCHCLLIESSQGLILVDSGFGLDDMEWPEVRLGAIPSRLLNIERDASRTAIRQIAALGYDPHDVKDIVLTNLDFDHSGGVSDFPWATVRLHQAEYEAATHPLNFRERIRYEHCKYLEHVDWATYSVTSRDSWFGFDQIELFRDRDIDMRLIPLPGHSAGHCGVALNQGASWLFHCGDAIMQHKELDEFEPDPPIGVRLVERLLAEDTGALESTQSLLRRLHQEQGPQVMFVCSHDPAMLEGIPPMSRGGAYAG